MEEKSLEFVENVLRFTRRREGASLSSARSSFMSQTVDAIFKDGTFKPIDNGSLDLSEGQRVKLTIDVPAKGRVDLLELAGEVYAGLSEREIAQVEKVALDRSKFFDDRSIS